MSRSLPRPLIAAALAALVTQVGQANPASAKPIDSGHFHGEFVETIDDFCGIEGLVVERSTVVDVAYRVSERQGLIYFQEHFDTTDVLTNQSTGESLTHEGTVLGKDVHVTDNGDGTITIVRLNTGNVTTYDESGKAVARDPGQLRERLVFDLAGTPDDPEDDVLVSYYEVLKESTGRNDDLCAVVAEKWG
jgi:hypothetical protein